MNSSNLIDLSVVIPVYNEEEVLDELFLRLYPALDKLNISYEIIFINDGSRDKSLSILTKQYKKRDDVTRVIIFNGNFGQHRAILAGFEYSKGKRIITLDADLQNQPEEIHLLLEQMDLGHDYVGTIRKDRKDSLWRHYLSRLMNRIRHSITKIKMTDQGCMMRAYSRNIIDIINKCDEMHTFIPALAYQFAQNPVEIKVTHEERFAGESKYSIYSLIRLNFDLMTGFSLVPLQLFSLLGIIISLFSFLFVVYLVIRRLVIGPEVDGVFTLFAIMFFLIGITLFGIGLLGEYIGRIYQEVRSRPRYLINTILENKEKDEQ